MPKPLKSFLTEALTERDFDQLRKDAGAFTKNIRRIANGKELAMVADAFRLWQNHYKNFVYNRFLGIEDDTRNQSDQFGPDETWERRNLRKVAWDVYIMSNVFITGSDYYLRDVNKRLVYNTETASSWDAEYAKFDKQRDSRYQKLSKSVREAFKAIDEYRAAFHADGVIPDRKAVETIKIDGVTIEIATSDLQTKDADARVAQGLAMIRQSIHLIRRANIPNPFNRLIVRLAPNNSGGDAAGTYRAGPRPVVNIMVWGLNTHTIVHEVGHHVFKTVLSPERQRAWEHFIKHNRVTFTHDELDSIHRAYLHVYEANRHTSNGLYTVSDIWENLSPSISLPSARLKFDNFMAHQFGRTHRSRILMAPYKNPDHDPGDTERKWNDFVEAAQQGFVMHASTEYSNKNPEEAFCETFAFYCHGRKMYDTMRMMFRQVIGFD